MGRPPRAARWKVNESICMDLSFAALQLRRKVKISSATAPRRKGMVYLHKTDQFNEIDLHRYTDRFDGVEDHRSSRLAFAMEIHLNQLPGESME